MKGISIARYLVAIVLVVALAGTSHAGEKKIKDALQELGLLNEFSISNIYPKSIFTDEEIFREFLMFSWGIDGKYHVIVPMHLCEFKTGTEDKIKIIYRQDFLNGEAKSVKDVKEVSLNAILKEAMDAGGVLKFIITLTPHQRKELGL